MDKILSESTDTIVELNPTIDYRQREVEVYNTDEISYGSRNYYKNTDVFS